MTTNCLRDEDTFAGLGRGRASRLPNEASREGVPYVLPARIPGIASSRPFPVCLPARFLVSMAATEGPIPTAEEKNRIITARKELIQALVKRRALDKQLVC